MTQLTYEDLNTSLLSVQNPVPNYQPYMFDVFTNLYNTGCRPHELFDSSRWSQGVGGDFELIPLKGNNTRAISSESLTEFFKTRFLAGYDVYTPFSVRRVRYHFNQFYGYPFTYIGNKEAELYLFRHRYIKALALNGDTTEQIMEKMGYTSTAVVLGYVNSEIWIP